MDNLYSINNLDNVRAVKGENELINSFSRLVSIDRENAVDLINGGSLRFATFFLLKDKIYENNLTHLLNERNRVAIELINEVQNNQSRNMTADITSLDYIQAIHSTLKWILETGADEYCSSDEYNEILDMSAIFLVKVYHDLSVLPTIADLLFERKCKGYYTHELVWAFFEARSVDSLEYIARGFLSKEESHVKLAYKLLNFVPNIKTKKDPYKYTMEWLEENRKFIFFTGETQHGRLEPVRCEVCAIAKYLNKRINPCNGELEEELNEQERSLLRDFDNGDYNQMVLLANYSQYLHRKGKVWWEIWHSYPLEKQVKIAKMGGIL